MLRKHLFAALIPILFIPLTARTSSAESYYLEGNEYYELSSSCRAAINDRIEAVDSIPWWAQGIAKNIAYQDVLSIGAGLTTPDEEAQALYERLTSRGMSDGWARDIKSKYRRALDSLTDSGGACS